MQQHKSIMQQQASTDYKYILEKRAAKGTCPECNHKNTFRYYEDLPREFGKCERINECGYWNKPTKEKLNDLGFTNSVSVKTKPQLTVVYPSDEQLVCLKHTTSIFHKFCIERLDISLEHLQKWNVGTDNRGNTTFVMQTISGKHLNIKTMAYNLHEEGKNCKRNKKINFYLKANENEVYKTCLFGEHLLRGDNVIICLVESEKTAVISSFFYPQFDWLATCGSNGLTVEKVQQLKNKQVYYLADNDKAGIENSSIKKLELYNIKFEIVQFDTSLKGEDLADIIIKGERPEIKSVQSTTKTNVATVTQHIETNVVATTQQQKSRTEIEHETFEKYSFFERGNEYFTKQQLKHSTKDLRIANFKMQIISKMNDGSDNLPVLIELTRNDNKKNVFEITSRDLHNPIAFSALIFVGGYNYNGSTYIYKNILESLHNDKNVSTYITTLGQQLKHDFYAFSTGILTTDGTFLECNEIGFVEYNNETFYIPSAKEENKENENYIDDIKFKYLPGKLTLDVFTEKIYSIYGIKGLIGLCYTIATIHRDIIFNETKFFPFMFLNGSAQSGKSTYINFFMCLFGIPQSETTENSTDKAIERKFSQINNNLQYIKEFSPTFEDNITNILKNAYDGTGYSRAQATQNNKTKTLNVRSGLVIDGNYFPTKDSALFSRLIFMIWKPTKTDEAKKHIQELQDLLNDGSGLIFSEIYKKRDYYKSNFSTIYRETLQEVKRISKSKKISFAERESTHIAMMASVFKISINLNEKAYSMFIDDLIEGTQTQMDINSSLDDVNRFFEVIETLENTARISSPHYYKRETNFDYQYLHMNFSACYLEYAKYQKDIGVKPTSEAELKQKLKFIESEEYYIESKKNSYSTEKFGDKSARSLVFKVKTGTFELTK